jgi:hypothetical protein
MGSVADGVGRVGGQMGTDGGDGRRQQCKNLVVAARSRRQKLDVNSVVPNSTKVIFKDHACDVLQDAMILL